MKSNMNDIASQISIASTTLNLKTQEITAFSNQLESIKQNLFAVNVEIKSIISEKRSVQGEVFKLTDALARDEEALAILNNQHHALLD